MEKCTYRDCELEVFWPKGYTPKPNDKPCCIFHSPLVEEKKEEFRDAWEEFFSKHRNSKGEYENLDCSGFVFPETIFFYGATFSGDVSFDAATFSAIAFFIGATFSGNASFEFATFSGNAVFYRATFSGNARFDRATFSGNASFDGARFSGDAGFSGARFSGHASFGFATFSGNARFDGAKFSDYAGFSGATFSGHASFGFATFSGNAIFYDATFSGSAGFGSAAFSVYAIFGDATYSGDASFSKTKFEGGTSFSYAEFKDASIDFIGGEYEDEENQKQDTRVFEKYYVHFSHINFSEAKRVRFEHVDLSSASFHRSRIENLDFIDVWWNGKEDYELYDEDIWREQYEKGEKTDKNELKEIENLYHQLVLNFDKRREYETGGEFYVREIEVRRWRKGFPKNIWEFIYWHISRYGQDRWLPLRLSFLLFLLFTTVFFSYDYERAMLSKGGQSEELMAEFSAPQSKEAEFFTFAKSFGSKSWQAVTLNMGVLLGVSSEETRNLPHNISLLGALERLLIIFLLSMFALALRRQFRR